MRIGAGARKGLSLPLPKALKIRPTLGRVKEALFDILSARIDGCTFLDLYAGTGSIGLEAHSRGASTVIFVEQNRKTAALLHRNVARYCTSMPPEQPSTLRIHILDVEAYLSNTRHRTTPVDIIFSDPPEVIGFNPTGSLWSSIASNTPRMIPVGAFQKPQPIGMATRPCRFMNPHLLHQRSQNCENACVSRDI